MAEITKEIQAGRCACEVKSRSGRCCLGEVNNAVKKLFFANESATAPAPVEKRPKLRRTSMRLSKPSKARREGSARVGILGGPPEARNFMEEIRHGPCLNKIDAQNRDCEGRLGRGAYSGLPGW
jgi:hypothetical protein